MKALSVLVLACSCASVSALSPPSSGRQEAEVAYVVDLARANTQHVDVSMRLPTGGRDACEVMLPTWRPGRYTILDQAGTVFGVEARSGASEPLVIRKTAKSAWAVQCDGADEVVVSYAVYANSLYDRTRHVDPTHAFLSGSSVFFYSPRLRSAPVTVEVRTPKGWEVATGLEADENGRLVAASYDVLVDSPIEVGEHDRIDFEVDGVPHEIVIWPRGIEHDAERLVEDFTKVVREHVAVFGRMPYSRYVFLVHAKRGAGGTEHLNSTIMQTSRGAIEGSVDRSSSYKSFLGLVSHEFFHTWNVKQLRPAGIHPYDYQRENYTDLLWVAEGTTSYYSALTLVRAGLRPVDEYLKGLGRSIDSLRRRPAARVTSLAAASFDTWIDTRPENAPNTRIDYYGKGALASLCMDMEIRRRTEGAESLDTVMRAMFERFPLSDGGYTTADLRAMLEERTGSSFDDFFERFIAGTEKLPFEEAFPVVGLELVFEPAKDEKGDDDEDAGGDDASPAETGATEPDSPEPPPEKAYLGLRLSRGGSGALVRTVLADGPAYGSGLLVGDEIVALNGRRLRPDDLDDELEDVTPGDAVELHVLRDDRLIVIEVTTIGIPDGAFEVHRADEPGDAQRAAYASWCGQDWPDSGEDDEDGAGEDAAAEGADDPDPSAE